MIAATKKKKKKKKSKKNDGVPRLGGEKVEAEEEKKKEKKRKREKRVSLNSLVSLFLSPSPPLPYLQTLTCFHSLLLSSHSKTSSGS